MLTLNKLRDEFYAVMRLLIGNADYYVDVYYKGRLYRIHVEDLNKTHRLSRNKVKNMNVDPRTVKKLKCKQCGSVIFNDVCMNVSCPSQSGGKPRNDQPKNPVTA